MASNWRTSISVFAGIVTATVLVGGCSSSAPTNPSGLAGGSTAATQRRVDAVRGDGSGALPNTYVTLRTASGDTFVLYCAASTEPLRMGQCSVIEGTGRFEDATVFESRFTLESVSDTEMRLTSQLLIPRLGGHVYAIAGSLVGGSVISSTPECSVLNDVKLTGHLEQLGRVTVTFAYCTAP